MAIGVGSRGIANIAAIVQSAAVTWALTTAGQFGTMKRCLASEPELQALRWLATDEVEEARAEQWRCPGVGPG